MNGAVNRMNDQMLKLLCTDHLIKFPCLTMFAALEAMKSKSASCLQFDVSTLVKSQHNRGLHFFR